jgi:alpha-tubulin suppressor-like RCC1 family protein
VALRSNGTIWTWGWGTYGQLGSGSTANRTSPWQVGAETNWALIVTGGSHNLAVKRDGTLWTCGYNSQGQIGDGTTGTNNNRSNFVQVGTGFRVPAN